MIIEEPKLVYPYAKREDTHETLHETTVILLLLIINFYFQLFTYIIIIIFK